ncbi:MAG TPA: MBL fold metallo-hydrolase [Polyangiaceae bacterium]|nr:MBL fold metallo-hydrolase [Polyangiaceae bacterium]
MLNPAGSLREIAPGVYAYLQSGGWGLSNAGLIVDGGQSLLIDSLYDVPLTRRMLQTMRAVEPAADRIDALVNTHANGDHCWGNQAVGAERIISSRATLEEMRELPPRLMATLVRAARLTARTAPVSKRLLRLLGRVGIAHAAAFADAAEFAVSAFGSFDFDGVRLTLPTQTFEGRMTLNVGDKAVELIEVGPAHTKGDVIVHVPHARIAFTGDILFIGSHPIIWEGPVQNWIDACDRLLALDVDVIVPGHGPITDKRGVQRTKDYWQRIVEVARDGAASGAAVEDLAHQVLASGYAEWSEASRVVANVATVARQLSGNSRHPHPVFALASMGRFERELKKRQ